MNIHSVPPRKTGLFDRLLFKLAGVDEAVLRRCPPDDSSKVRSVAQIQIANFLYVSAMLAIMAHRLFEPSGRFRPEFVLGAVFLGGMLCQLDALLFVHTSWMSRGLSLIKEWGGYPISGGFSARVRSAIALAVRLILSVGLASLIGISASLLVVADDVRALLNRDWLEANRQVIETATALVDDRIKKAQEAVDEESARVSALSVQVGDLRAAEIDPSANDARVREGQKELTDLLARQARADDDVRDSETRGSLKLGGIKVQGTSGIAGDGPMHRAAIEQVSDAKRRARDAAAEVEVARHRLDVLRQQNSTSDDAARQRAHGQLPEFESALATEITTLATLKDQYERLSQNREEEIRHDEESSPNYVPLNEGFLAQAGGLARIAESNPAQKFLVIAIEMTSFGFEFAVVLVAMMLVPTQYSLLAVRDLYEETIRVADHMASVSQKGSDRGIGDEVLASPSTANDNRGAGAPSVGEIPIFWPVEMPGPQPAKRKRGRPRKSPPPN